MTYRYAYQGKRIRFELPMPRRDEKSIVMRPGSAWMKRTPLQQEAAYEQACRQRWRALLLSIKAKVEAVQAGISTFENEFLAFVVLPGGETVGQRIVHQIEAAYQTGAMPPLLGAGANT